MEKARLLQELSTRMEGAMKVLNNELKGRRASINLLDPVVVEAYGSRIPLAQVATISTLSPMPEQLQFRYGIKEWLKT